MTSEGSSYGGFEPADGAFPGRHHSRGGQRPPADLPPWNGFAGVDPDAEEPDSPPPGVPDQHWDSPRASASQPADPRGGYPPPPAVYRSSTGAAEPAPRTGAVYGGGARTSGSAAVPPPPPAVPATPAAPAAPPTSPAGPGRATVYGSARGGAPTPPPPPPPVPHVVPAPPTPPTPVVPAPTSPAVPVAARRPAAYPPADQASYAPPQQRAPHPSERQPDGYPDERYAEPATASSRVYGAPRGGEPVEPAGSHPDQHRTAAYPAAGSGYPPNDGSGYPPPPPHGNPGGRGAPDGGQQYGQPVPPPPPARPSGGTTYGAAPAGRPPAPGGQPPQHPQSGHPGYPPPPPPEDPNATSIIPVTRDTDRYAQDPYAPDPYAQDPYAEPDPYAAEPDPYAEQTRVPGDRPSIPVPPPAPEPAAKPGRGKLVAGIVLALVVVLALSGIAYYLAVVRGNSADYKIGSCVKQQGTSAVLEDCSQAGVYRIDKQVPDKSACDATQPYIIVDNKNGTTDTFCLVPK